MILKATVASYCVTDVLFPSMPETHKSSLIPDYAAPLDSDLKIRTSFAGM